MKDSRLFSLFFYDCLLFDVAGEDLGENADELEVLFVIDQEAELGQGYHGRE